MRLWALSSYALTNCVGLAFLAGCTAAQPPIAMPGVPNAALPIPDDAYNVIHSFKGGRDGSTPLAEEAPLIVAGGVLYGTTASGGGHGCSGVGCGTAFQVMQSGSESVLYSFQGGTDGINPAGTLVRLNGAFYGTTAAGGATNNGIVFVVDQSGRERVLYSFKGGATDGANPFGRLLAIDGTLYGTTAGGGKHRLGTVFAITPSGKERLLHSFKLHRDGANPYAGLTKLKGVLYGTTSGGGAVGSGTVFAITTSGAEHVVYSFRYGTDGAGPLASLIAVGGNLYGTTTGGGGQARMGTVFEVAPSGSERVLHSFKNDLIDGGYPESALLDVGGTLYGTASQGGRKGAGVVFSVTMSGRERVLHNFDGGKGGGYPTGGLIVINDTLYGTTSYGGNGPCYNGAGCGTIFALAL